MNTCTVQRSMHQDFRAACHIALNVNPGNTLACGCEIIGEAVRMRRQRTRNHQTNSWTSNRQSSSRQPIAPADASAVCRMCNHARNPLSCDRISVAGKSLSGAIARKSQPVADASTEARGITYMSLSCRSGSVGRRLLGNAPSRQQSITSSVALLFPPSMAGFSGTQRLL